MVSIFIVQGVSECGTNVSQTTTKRQPDRAGGVSSLAISESEQAVQMFTQFASNLFDYSIGAEYESCQTLSLVIVTIYERSPGPYTQPRECLDKYRIISTIAALDSRHSTI